MCRQRIMRMALVPAVSFVVPGAARADIVSDLIGYRPLDGDGAGVVYVDDIRVTRQ